MVVTRAGDVIPQVISPLVQKRKGKRLRKAKPPKKCPACGTPTVKPDDAVFTICPNRRGCPGQTFQQVKHFVRGGDGHRGLRREAGLRFLDEGLIADPADIYDLTAEQLAELEGFGEISARNLIDGDRGVEEQPFSLVLFALGLPGRRLRHRPGAGRALRRDGRADGRRRRGDRAGRGRRPDPRRADPRGARGGADPDADRPPARARPAVRAGRVRAPRRRAARSTARRSSSPARCPT